MDRDRTARRGIGHWLLAGVLLVGCGGGGGGSGPRTPGGNPPPVQPNRELAVAAGLEPLTPTSAAQVGSIDLARLGVGKLDALYDLTSPAGEPFAVNLLARGQNNTGAVRVSLAHVTDGGSVPAVGVRSISDAGILPSGAGVLDRAPWLDARGDGFSRLTLRGSITRDQELLVQAETPRGLENALVRIRIGARSRINVETQGPINAPFVIDQRTIYSSDSWMFGLPTCAVSGDRTSVVVYEGNDGDEWSGQRYEMRIQVDDAGNVTGGASDETSDDHGSWRDHELAGLFNVLAVAHSGDQDVKVRLSFDRGATFPQEETLASGQPQHRQRLIQTAMAADYTLAVVFWRARNDAISELVLIEGSPSAFDASGSPTQYAFGSPTVIHTASGDVTPAIMGAAWSAGGDLVIGYGATSMQPRTGEQPGMEMRSYFRCATRLFGGSFTDVPVDEEISINFDPSVSLIGQGAGLNIWYAYETQTGVRLRTSGDAGQTFSPAIVLGDRTAHLPSVFAVEVAGQQRVDVLYLAQRDLGTELHLARWNSFDPAAAPSLHALSTASQSLSPQGVPLLTGVAWLGYDACLRGDDLVVVFQETTQDFVCMGGPMIGAVPPGAPMAASAAGGFTAATPPPLAPGLTNPLPAPDAADRHQLKLLRLD